MQVKNRAMLLTWCSHAAYELHGLAWALCFTHLQRLHQVWLDGIFHQHSQSATHALQRKIHHFHEYHYHSTYAARRHVTAADLRHSPDPRW